MSSTARHHTFSRRSFLQTAAASGIALGAGAVLGSAATESAATGAAPQPNRLNLLAATSDPAEQRPFDPNHPVYQPIPTNCSLDPFSSRIVANIASNYHELRFDAGANSPNVYVGKSTDPVWSVRIRTETYQVHAPADLGAGTDVDGPLVLLDASSSQFNGHPVEYRMWQALIDASTHTITCSNGGVGVYGNNGAVLDITVQSKRVKRALGQAEIFGSNTGSGCSYTVGMIRPIDVQRGRIDHAIRIAAGYLHLTRYFWPALHPEDWGTRLPRGCPMGARIFLDPGVDIDTLVSSLNVSEHGLDELNIEFARLVLTAMKEFGLIVLDGTRGSNVIYMEGMKTANWTSLIGKVNSSETYNHIGRAIQEVLPWSSLRVAASSVFDGYAHTPVAQ